MKKYLLFFILLAFPLLVQARGFDHKKNPPTPAPPPVVTPVTTSNLTVGAFNTKVGTVQVAFDAWTDPPSCFAGQTTFIYWENYGVSLDSIINGSQDSIIKSFSQHICPNTILSLFHESNGNWDPWDANFSGSGNSPQLVIQAYQHIHDIIGNKVKYAWVMNNVSEPSNVSTDFAQYYPGSAYVDIIGIDGFNFGGQDQETFSQTFDTAIAQMKQYGKPIWLTSVGSVSTGQTQFLSDMFGLSTSLGVSGIIYFDYDVFTLSSQNLANYKLNI